MLLSRVLGAVGRFCIGLGVLTLLFVTYQLWGTGILTAQAQGGLEDDFEALVSQAEDLEPTAVATAEPAPSEVDELDERDAEAAAEAAAAQAEADALAAEAAAEERALLSELLWQPGGEPVARLTIPKIDLEWTIVAGVGTDELRKGPGHYPGTPLPGMPGNAGVAGHRTTWGAPFNRIDELDPGDIITVETVQGDFEYRVIEQDSGKGHFIVSPNRVDVLDQDFTDHPNRLTLTACHPKFSARQRIIVVAELIGTPADFIPPPEFLGDPEIDLASEDFDNAATEEESADLPGDPDLIAEEDEPADEPVAGGDDTGADATDDEPAAAAAADTAPPPAAQRASLQAFSATENFGNGLNGDRSAIFPAVMWGLAATAIAIAAGFVASRWRKIPSYALGVVPFALVLFVCFVHIDQALPSY